MKRVPIWTPLAPSIKAAAKPFPSPIPPAAITGIETAFEICGINVNVVNSRLELIPAASEP